MEVGAVSVDIYVKSSGGEERGKRDSNLRDQMGISFKVEGFIHVIRQKEKIEG